jgi:hypothetical protein
MSCWRTRTTISGGVSSIRLNSHLPTANFDILSRSGFPEPCSIADTAQVFKTDPAICVCGLLNETSSRWCGWCLP